MIVVIISSIVVIGEFLLSHSPILNTSYIIITVFRICMLSYTEYSIAYIQVRYVLVTKFQKP